MARTSELVHAHTRALTTMSAARLHNLWAWDDPALGVDFVQVHSYPDVNAPERDADVFGMPATSLGVAKPVVLGEFPGNGPEQHPPGDIVIRQGDTSKQFYVLRQGKVDILREDGGETKVINTIGEGACFGEEALIKSKPRNATVRASEPTMLYVLGEDDFRAALETSETLRQELQKVLFERQ